MSSKAIIRYNRAKLTDSEKMNVNDEGMVMLVGTDIEISDGYHTMDELYEHRHELFIALVRQLDNYVTPLGCRHRCWKSKLHNDGTMFDDSFILGISSSEFNGPESQITYHLPLKYWDRINVMEFEMAPPYDGHTSDDVLERLRKL